MSVLRLYDPAHDPNDPNTPTGGAVYLGMYSVDPVAWTAIKTGAPWNLPLSTTLSSDDPWNLVILNPPFSQGDIYMAWGNFNGSTGILTLYLATSTGDTTYPFADIKGFGSVLDNIINTGQVGGGGDAYLNRPQTIPTYCKWDVYQ